MTLGPGITVHGTSGTLDILTGTLINQGAIDSDGGGALDIHGNPGAVLSKPRCDRSEQCRLSRSIA